MDTLTPKQRSHLMSRIRGKDTTPELVVRRLVHSLGYRYRLHVRKLPGCPDLVFPSRCKTIFVHGCFWHRHSCRKGRSIPSTRKGFWQKKLNGNKQRDRKTKQCLKKLGWDVLVLWECQTKRPEPLVERIIAFLEG